MRLTRLFGAALGATVLTIPLAYAQEEAPPPSDEVVMLPCDGQCVTITRNPKRISGGVIHLPEEGSSNIQGPSGTRIAQYNSAEGLVELQYTIKADGSVANDVDILRLVGPQSFADTAKRTVRDWRYEPAMANGKPISITHKLRIYYGSGNEQGARSSIITGYNESAAMIKSGKLEEADGKLAEMYRLPSINFYERGMLIYLRTLIAMQRKDCVEAKRLSDVALAFGYRLLRSTYESLYRMHIASALCVGDVVGAAKVLGDFKKEIGIGDADPLVAQVESMKRTVDELPSYAMNVKIPDAQEEDGFGFYLYRRDFTFTKVEGALFNFTASCRERQVDSPITDKAEWHIPRGWSDCFVWVRGRPGTTFQIVQFAAAPPAK